MNGNFKEFSDAEEQESWSGYERCMTYTIFALFVIFILGKQKYRIKIWSMLLAPSIIIILAFVYYLAMIAG